MFSCVRKLNKLICSPSNFVKAESLFTNFILVNYPRNKLIRPFHMLFRSGTLNMQLDVEKREIKNSDHIIQQRRNKYTKKSQKGFQKPEYDSGSDSEEEEELTPGTKVVTTRVQSLRLDGLLKKALGIARNKVQTSFYEGNIRVNGKKPDKKSFQLKIGDEIDMIRGVSPMNSEFLNVSRVEVISIKEDNNEDGDEEYLVVKLRRTKTMYVENYQLAPWKKSSTEGE